MLCSCRLAAQRATAVGIAKKNIIFSPKWLQNSAVLIMHNAAARNVRTVGGNITTSTRKSKVKTRQTEAKTEQRQAAGNHNETSRRSRLGRGKEKLSETEKIRQNHATISMDDLREYPFLSLGVSKQLVRRLDKNCGIKDPVEIQSLAIRPISSRKNLVIHSETGSGKTLAYLLPVIQQAKYRCHTIIAVPTRELAYQIYLEARKLTPKKDVACYVTRPDIETEFQKLKESPPKIIIGTPKQLLSVIRDHEFLFSYVRRFVADEIDKMLPPIPMEMRRLIKKREKHPKPLNLLLAVVEGISQKKVQYIACSATINDQMINNLKDLQWGHKLRVIKSEKCSEMPVAVPSGIKHNYIFIPDFSIDSKVAGLSKIFMKTGKKPSLVFVHRDHSSNDYVRELKDLNINAAAYYKQLLGGGLQDIQNFLEDFRTGKISVVVASEEEVRGLDFKELEHVFILDVPRSSEEYLHLAGRVGRLGKSGMVTTVIAEVHDTGFQRLQQIYKQLGVSGNEIES